MSSANQLRKRTGYKSKKICKRIYRISHINVTVYELCQSQMHNGCMIYQQQIMPTHGNVYVSLSW